MSISFPTARLAPGLLERPGVLFGQSALIEALYPDPDLEPEQPDLVLRKRVQQLRAALLLVSGGQVQVRTERGVGYAVEARR